MSTCKINVDEITPSVGTTLTITADTLSGTGYNYINNAIETTVSKHNYIINGGMQIAQRGVSFVAFSGGYTLDRWDYIKNSEAVHTITQDADVPTNCYSAYSLKIDCTTADTSIGTTQYAVLAQMIEGNNIKLLVGKSITLSFWVKATKTGTYCVAFRSSIDDYSYIAEYTVLQSEVWEKKTITLSLNYGGGSWYYDHRRGLGIFWVISSGTSFNGTANVWQSGTYLSTSNQVNGCDSTNNNFWITEVMLNEGTIAAPFRLSGLDYQGELAKCQRYYYRTTTSPHLVGVVQFTTRASRVGGTHPVTMRCDPIAGYGGSVNIVGGAIFDGTTSSAISSIITNYSTSHYVEIDVSCDAAGLTVGRAAIVYTGLTSYLEVIAEL